MKTFYLALLHRPNRQSGTGGWLRNILIVLPLIAGILTYQPANAADTSTVSENSRENKDIESIKILVGSYYFGMYHNDETRLRKLFLSDAPVVGYLDGVLEKQDFQAWLQKIKSAPAPVSRKDKYEYKIELIDITEKVALVKVNDTYIGKQFTDYLSLINIDNQWIITGKTFFNH